IGLLPLVENGLKDGFVNEPMSLDGLKSYLLILKECAHTEGVVVPVVEQWNVLGKNTNGWPSMNFWPDFLITTTGLIEVIAMFPMMIFMKGLGKYTNAILILLSGQDNLENSKPITTSSVLGGNLITSHSQMKMTLQPRLTFCGMKMFCLNSLSYCKGRCLTTILIGWFYTAFGLKTGNIQMMISKVPILMGGSELILSSSVKEILIL